MIDYILYIAQGCLQVRIILVLIEENKENHGIPVNPTINGAATWTVYQFSPNKNLC